MFLIRVKHKLPQPGLTLPVIVNVLCVSFADLTQQIYSKNKSLVTGLRQKKKVLFSPILGTFESLKQKIGKYFNGFIKLNPVYGTYSECNQKTQN